MPGLAATAPRSLASADAARPHAPYYRSPSGLRLRASTRRTYRGQQRATTIRLSSEPGPRAPLHEAMSDECHAAPLAARVVGIYAGTRRPK